MSPAQKEKSDRGWKTDGHGKWRDEEGDLVDGKFEVIDSIKVDTEKEDITVEITWWFHGKKQHAYLNREQVKRLVEKLQNRLGQVEKFMEELG